MTNPTEKTNSAMERLMQRYGALQTENVPQTEPVMTQEEFEEQLHAEVWRNDWQEVLRLLALPHGQLPRGAINECLGRALHTATAAEFTAILDRLPPGEYTEKDTYYVDWSPTGEPCNRLRWEVVVQGTLVMHAVACKRPELLEILLDRGYDVNCASLRAASALLTDHSELTVGYGTGFVPFQPYTARPESLVKLCCWDTAPDDIPPMAWEGVTPLALAVLLGQAECARILVERGAWLEESPPVSSVMYLFWLEENEDYQAARQAVLAVGDHQRHRPVLWAVGEVCSARQLEEVLTAWEYSLPEMVQAASSMVDVMPRQERLWESYEGCWLNLYQRILCLGRICPEAIRHRSVIGPFLWHFLPWKQADVKELLPFLEGATLDISQIGLNLFDIEKERGRSCLKELGKHCTLVMDRDDVFPNLLPHLLYEWLSMVTFLPPVMDQGVSGLTRALLHTGDLKRIRGALKKGMIPPEESTEELLRCQQELGLPVVCRSALLTTPRPQRGTLRECPLEKNIFNRWFREIPQADTMPILDAENWEELFWPSVRSHFGKRTVTAMGRNWEVSTLLYAVCMEGRADILEPWLRVLPREELCNISDLNGDDRETLLVTTPLCAAALAGQREVVELLLRHGAPAQEELWGCPSVIYEDWSRDDKGKGFPLNPVLAAALGDHWDVVRCLLCHGATWQPDAPEVQYLWKKYRTEDLQEVLNRHLKGG